MASEIKYLDTLGNKISVGDLIVYATRDSCHAYLHVGQVKELGRRESRWDWDSNARRIEPTLKVRALKPSNWRGEPEVLRGGSLLTLAHLDRVAVISEVSSEFEKLLSGEGQ